MVFKCFQFSNGQYSDPHCIWHIWLLLHVYFMWWYAGTVITAGIRMVLYTFERIKSFCIDDSEGQFWCEFLMTLDLRVSLIFTLGQSKKVFQFKYKYWGYPSYIRQYSRDLNNKHLNNKHLSNDNTWKTNFNMSGILMVVWY